MSVPLLGVARPRRATTSQATARHGAAGQGHSGLGDPASSGALLGGLRSNGHHLRHRLRLGTTKGWGESWHYPWNYAIAYSLSKRMH